MPSEPKPHDRLFKAAFSAPERARELIRPRLPAAAARLFDWQTLRLESSTIIDAVMDDRYTDLLFSVDVVEPGAKSLPPRAFIYVLLEHQSSVDRDMPLRMVGYIARIAEQLRRDKLKGSLPLIIPMLVTHVVGGWNGPRSLWDVFRPHPKALPELLDHIPSYTMLIEDLSEVSNEQLKRRALEAFPMLALWLLRDARDADVLFANLPEWASKFGEALRAPNGVECVALLMRYVAIVCDKLEMKLFRAKIREHLPEAEKAAMTLAEQLRQEGRQEGLREALSVVLRSKFAEVPREYLDRLTRVSETEFGAYVQRIMQAQTLDQVFEPQP